MHLSIYIVLVFVVLWLAYSAYQWAGAKNAAKGLEIGGLLPQVSAHRQTLVYCYSPACGPCKRMSPMIDELCQKGHAIVKLDVSKQLEVADQLHIRAVPTLLVVHDGVIDQVLLGIHQRQEIEALLSG